MENAEKLQNEEIEIDLREIFFLLLRHIWIIILSAVIGVASFGFYTYTMIDPLYESQSMMYVLTKSTSLTSLADVQLGTQLTNDYVVFITSRPVVDKVIDNLDLDMTYKEFLDHVSVDNPSNTRILKVTVRHTDPQMAQTIVNELTDVAASRVAEVMDTDAPRVADYGHLPEHPSSPSIVKNSAIGGMLLALLAIAIIVIHYLLNDSIKTSDDVERYLGLNVLGMIPLEEGTSKRQTHGRDVDGIKMARRNKKAAKKAAQKPNKQDKK